jgi:SAM-dependent MidA family methyltransferase
MHISILTLLLQIFDKLYLTIYLIKYILSFIITSMVGFKNPELTGEQRPHVLSLIAEQGELDPSLTDIMEETISFSDFMALTMHGKKGLYENINFDNGEMLMLPQLSSPLFGTFMAGYLSNLLMENSAESATFLGLASGGGYLDEDMIDTLLSKDFSECLPDDDLEANRRLLSTLDKSRFLVTERTGSGLFKLRNKIGRLATSLQVEFGVGQKIRVRELDATNFNLNSSGTVAAYANELVDALETEPVIQDNSGNRWLVRMAPYDARDGEERGKIGSKIGVNGLIHPSQLTNRVDEDEEAVDNIRFKPVFVPIETSPELASFFENVGGKNRIMQDRFNGILPLHTKVPGVLRSVRDSFERGSVTLIDYFDIPRNDLNYVVAVTGHSTGGHRFGKQDITFHIDPEQIDTIAEKLGMTVRSPGGVILSEYLNPLIDIYNRVGPSDRAILMWFIKSMASRHTVMTYSFSSSSNGTK